MHINTYTFTNNLCILISQANRRIICHALSGGQLLSLSQRIDSEQELVTGDAKGRLMYWDIDARDPVCVVQDPACAPIRSCEVSRTGRFLAFAGDDQASVSLIYFFSFQMNYERHFVYM
jgi:hypothetical protein